MPSLKPKTIFQRWRYWAFLPLPLLVIVITAFLSPEGWRSPMVKVAAIAWSAQHEHPWISVDFQPPNPLSRRFWLGAAFIPTGYGVVRAIHPSHGPT